MLGWWLAQGRQGVVEPLRASSTCPVVPRCKEKLGRSRVALHLGLHGGEGAPKVELAVSVANDLNCPSSAEVDSFVRAQINRRLCTSEGSWMDGVDWGYAKGTNVIQDAHINHAMEMELGGVI